MKKKITTKTMSHIVKNHLDSLDRNIVDSNGRMPLKVAKSIVDNLFLVLGMAIQDGAEIVMPEIGKIIPHTFRAGRAYHNVQTGGISLTKEKRTIKVLPSQGLVLRLNKK